METDHNPRAKPTSNTSHAFPLWNNRQSFCGLTFREGETGLTDRTTCKSCLKQLENIRKNTI